MRNKSFLFFYFLLFFLVLNFFLVSGVTYTPTTETSCSKGVCNKVLYSGVRFVNEDNTWKKVEDARSLKDSGIEVTYLENDENYPVEIVDYNYTSITLKLNPKGVKVFTEDIPITIWEYNESKESSKEKKEYQNNMDIKRSDTLTFSLLNQEMTKTYDFGFGKILQFGEHSTSILLSSPQNVENDDTIGSTDWIELNYCSDGENSFGCHIGEMGQATEYSIKVVKDDTIQGNEKSINNSLPTNYAYSYYGDVDDLWGLSWSYEDINNESFGLVFSVNTSSTISKYLKFYNFSANIPSNAVIEGIIVGVRQKDGFNYPAVDTANINITYSEPDAINPYFTTIPENVETTYPYNLGVLFQAEDETEFDSYSSNETNFPINSSGYLNNSVGLSVGVYNINITINDTSNNINSTIFTLTINKGTPSINLSSSIGWSSEDESYATINGTCYEELECNLYLLDINVSNPYTDLFTDGSYRFDFNTTGNDNYTTRNVENTLVIGETTSTGGIGNLCRYRKFGYYNLNIPFMKEVNCI